MAGHSKWANIKHKKAKEDAVRGKTFTKLSKEITVCAKEAGGDPAGNPRLRTLLEKARAVNMPQDNIKRAIQKGTGELPGLSYEQHMYEGHGPHGMAVLVEVLTDNKNRAIAELRHAFTRQGGSVAANGSVSWMFAQKGVVKGTHESATEDSLLEALLETEVEAISQDENHFIITGSAKGLAELKEAALKAGMKVEHAEIEWIAKDPLSLSDEAMEQAAHFLDALDELDDIQNIYSNIG